MHRARSGVAVVDQFDRGSHRINGVTRAFGRKGRPVRNQIATKPDANLEFEAEMLIIGQ